MIRWQQASVSYAGSSEPVLHSVDLEVPEAELVVVAGRTGSGKSTLLRTVNGLVPRFTGGRLTGEVFVGGQRVRDTSPRELTTLVGYVGQDPAATFVADVVEEELAYGMEQLGLDPQTMRRRVEETLDLLGIAELRRRSVRSLSGGQQQRVAIGAVLTMHPRCLVLDEPTSALDPTAAEDVLGALTRLVHDVGLTVLLAEHRLERVVPFADEVVVLDGGRAEIGPPTRMLERSPVAPPIVQLGRLAGWQPLPLSIRDARRRTTELAAQLGEAHDPSEHRPDGVPLLQARAVTVRYGAHVAVREVSLAVGAGRVLALMGRNGSGKSSLLWALQGTGRRHGGEVRVDGTDPASVSPDQARSLVGLVPQNATDLLYLESVGAECAAADQQSRATGGTCRELLDALAPGVPPDRHPRDLSEGQRLALVLAIVLTSRPRVVALDEPTRGLDYAGKHKLSEVLTGLAREGRAVLVASHDVEFVAQVADEVVVMADGDVVSAGPAGRVLAESPPFAPQVSKILGPQWLTVEQVAGAMS